MEAVVYCSRDVASVISLSIRVTRVPEINAITFNTMEREVQSLKKELRALRNGHLSTSEVKLPWSPDEKLRHESNGHAECDHRCETCVSASGISRHPRRVYSESCAFHYASTFKESHGDVTVLTGRGPRCECFCRVVPRKGQRLKDLEVSGNFTDMDSGAEERSRHVGPLDRFDETSTDVRDLSLHALKKQGTLIGLAMLKTVAALLDLRVESKFLNDRCTCLSGRSVWCKDSRAIPSYL